MIQLTEDQRDVLAEIFNMGMGKSIHAMSYLSGEDHEIVFELPALSLSKTEEFLSRFTDDQKEAFVIQRYSGEISGSALMYYPGSDNARIVKLLIGTEVPAEEISNLESDAMIEVGNIFINAALSCLADFVELEINTEIPELFYQDGISKEIFHGDYVIEIDTEFKIEHLEIFGRIAFVLSNKTTEALIKKIDESLE